MKNIRTSSDASIATDYVLIIILDDIADPGNMGTIIRSAVAFNYDTIIVSPTSVDIYNEKVIRGTEGMLFNLKIIIAPLEEEIIKLKDLGYLIYGTDVNGGASISKEEKKHAKEIEKEKEYMQSDEYIAQVAREKLGLVKDNEIVFDEEN